MASWVAFYLILISAAAFGAFAFDKHRAEVGGRRVHEDSLLRLVLLGGAPGAMAAQQILRHKTRKEPFRTKLRIILGLQVFLLVAATVIWRFG